MAQLIIEIPDGQALRVLARLCEAYGCPANMTTIPERVAFLKSYIADQFRQTVLNQERRNAAAAVVEDDPGLE